MTDQGNGTTLRSPSAREFAFGQALAEAMRTPVGHCLSALAHDFALRAAATHPPVADASEAVAADPAVLDAQTDPDYSDSVEHSSVVPPFESGLSGAPGRATAATAEATGALVTGAEYERQARLRRWQAVDPRERRT